MLDGSETNALLLDNRFAEAHALSVGDMLATGEGDGQVLWLIKGIVRDVEYVYYAPEGSTVPDYHKYGFAYTNTFSLPDVAFNEIILTVHEETNLLQEELMTEFRESLGSVNILSRDHQASCRKTSDSLTGIKQIGLLFSASFFLTATLVTWITVSCIMEHQRQNLGTLRSLGYSKKAITRRYALFGVLITILGMVLGWLLSRYLIAQSLYNVGIAYYTIEVTGVEAFSPYLLISALCIAAVTCGGAILFCLKSLKSMPSEAICWSCWKPCNFFRSY